MPESQSKKVSKKKPAAPHSFGRRSSRADGAKPVNLALQGGGSQGAFTWGVLDQLLMDERIAVESISGTSAGAINAVVMAYGLIKGGREEARRLLRIFWRKVSHAASFSPLQPSMVDKLMGNQNLTFSPSFMALEYITQIFSPYELNLFDINPLRSIIEEIVDFRALRENDQIKVFVNATNVRTGKIKVFNTEELTLDMVMASTCLPFIFKTVYVDGEPYWDGGYSGNPAIYPLIYHCSSPDVILIQINPLNIDEVPTKAPDILDRVNEISFNSTLMREMRAISFVTKLLDKGAIKENGYKTMYIHMVEAEALMAGLGRASKLNADWDFLVHLHDIGVQAAYDWIEGNYQHIGKKSSIDVHDVFL